MWNEMPIHIKHMISNQMREEILFQGKSQALGKVIENWI